MSDETPKRPPFKAWQSMTEEEKFLQVRWNIAVGSSSVRETQFVLAQLDYHRERYERRLDRMKRAYLKEKAAKAEVWEEGWYAGANFVEADHSWGESAQKAQEADSLERNPYRTKEGT